MSEMYRGVLFEMSVIVCSSPPTSAVGVEEFDSHHEAGVSVTCLSEAFLDRDIHFNLGCVPDFH